MEEEWKPIKGYDSKYLISNLGRLKSLKSNKELIRKPNLNRDGYLYIQLLDKSQHKTFKVHRLVCEYFCEGMSEIKNHVDHIDANKTNNKASNLRWCSQLENNKFWSDLKTHVGESHQGSILKEHQVIEIKIRIASGEKVIDFFHEYGSKINAVYDIKQGRTWKHLK